MAAKNDKKCLFWNGHGAKCIRWASLLLLSGMALLMLVAPLRAQTSHEVIILTFDGPVNPMLFSYLERGIARAEQSEAAALVLRLDTPGGQVDLTLDIIKAMHASRVPTIVYVWPSGAMAGSAGTFITLAGSAAAMTPGSTIGAASPVADDGQEIGDTLRAKITNILAAEIENLTKRRGETAVNWARKAVIESKAATAEQALELGVIDAVAVDVEDLLRQLDGLEVEVNGQQQTLQLTGAPIVELPMTGPEDTLNTLVNAIAVPGIAILLIVLGVQAIIGEFSQPGGYVLGTAGVVAALLGMFALGILNANWVGLGFILLSFLLFILDIKAPTHGVLTVAGIATFVLGSVVLFSGTEAGIPWPTIIGLAAFSTLFFGFIIAKVIQSQRTRPFSGVERLIGATGEVRRDLDPDGAILVQGELWKAELKDESGPVSKGTKVTVVDRTGFKLWVRRAVQ
jgi:membrane-bound serine protease (ClpP class)